MRQGKGGPDHLLDKPKAFARRQAIWRHNSFSGHVNMLRSNMLAITKSSTASDDAKSIAQHIWDKSWELSDALEHRIDND